MTVLPTTSLEGRVAAVTGGGRGFGRQIALELAALGADVAVLDIDRDAGAACAKELREAGVRALGVACQVAEERSVEEAFRRIASELGPVDLLVNNAGIVAMTPFLEVTEEEWDRIVTVDLTSMFLCAKQVVPGMVERRFGRIVNLSSVAGKRGGGFLGRVPYSSAKAGVLGFTKALARELAPHGVTVNAVAPGAMDTEMTRVLREDPELLAKVEAQIPLGTRGTIQDVADAVAFLCTDLASYLTGETIDVDGGVLME